MSLIWHDGPEATNDRFVLLCLADYADDRNECWPSIAGIQRKTCLSERGVQTIIRRLQDTGWLEIQPGGGRKNCNLYRIKTPQEMQGLTEETPQQTAETPQMTAINPAGAAPEPSRTIKNHHPIGAVQKTKPKKPRRKPSRSLPENFVPDLDKARSLMAELDLNKQEMNFCYQQMKGHAYATDRKQANWDQAFGNWVRKAVQSGEVGPRSSARRNNGTETDRFDGC